MLTETSFVMRNDFADLGPAAEKTTEFLESHEASASAVFAANLAIEELATNTIKYGYRDQDEHQIHISIRLENGSAVIEMIDDGHPFDPFGVEHPNLALPVQDREIGGLGIHFVRNLIDTHHYERRDGKNVVTLRKKISDVGA